MRTRSAHNNKRDHMYLPRGEDLIPQKYCTAQYSLLLPIPPAHAYPFSTDSMHPSHTWSLYRAFIGSVKSGVRGGMQSKFVAP